MMAEILVSLSIQLRSYAGPGALRELGCDRLEDAPIVRDRAA